MMNSSFMNIFLNNRLGDDLFSRCLNSLYSVLGVVSDWLNNRFLLNSLIFSSVDSDLNIFSLDNWLDVFLVIDFFTRSVDSLSSWSLSNLSFSCNRVSIYSLCLRRNKINSFCVIDNSSFDNRLCQNFFSRSLIVFESLLVVEFSWSCYSRMIDCSGLTSLNIQLFGDSLDCWLNILFSDCYLSWDIHCNISGSGSVINNRVFVDSFSVYRSWNNFLSDNRSLNNSLSDDWLGNDFLGDDWLRDDFSSDNWFRYNLLSLGDNRFRVKNLSLCLSQLSSNTSSCGFSCESTSQLTSGNHFSCNLSSSCCYTTCSQFSL